MRVKQVDLESLNREVVVLDGHGMAASVACASPGVNPCPCAQFSPLLGSSFPQDPWEKLVLPHVAEGTMAWKFEMHGDGR